MAVLLLAATLMSLVTACTAWSNPNKTPSVSLIPPSATPAYGLLLPGAAAAALAELQTKVGDAPILRVTLTAQQATLTYLDIATERPMTLRWENNVIEQLDLGIVWVNQASFKLSDFVLDDLGAMFRAAAEVSGSDINQELQITEYNEARVLMSVTTSPESVPVFFYPNASMVNQLDFTTSGGVKEAIRDSCVTARVLAIGLDQQGFWADIRRDVETIERFIRPAGLPVYSTLRSQSSELTEFDCALADAEVISNLLVRLPAELTGNAQSGIKFGMDTRDDEPAPKLYFTVGFTTMEYEVDGRPVVR
ncbi:MAG: hypothetical protein LBJ43_04290 [Propionibacteriaceae bacterium]|nr:hypothetical protein [Propionibacteriaceae bacterium]